MIVKIVLIAGKARYIPMSLICLVCCVSILVIALFLLENAWRKSLYKQLKAKSKLLDQARLQNNFLIALCKDAYNRW